MLWVLKSKLLIPVASYCLVHSGDFYSFLLGAENGLQHFVKSPSVS